MLARHIPSPVRRALNDPQELDLKEEVRRFMAGDGNVLLIAADSGVVAMGRGYFPALSVISQQAPIYSVLSHPEPS